MITISIRDVGKYKDVEIEVDKTKINLGLLCEKERLDLADDLIRAIYGLLSTDQFEELLSKHQ